MKVGALVQTLQALPDQDATVVIEEGVKSDMWLIVSGLVGRQIACVNDDLAILGNEPAVGIV
jgi:hypothetical protein